MTYAFDLDGTITSRPQLLGRWAAQLMMRGDRVIVLTACAGELPIDSRQWEAEKRVKFMGFPNHSVHWVEQSEKGKMANALGVDVMIDDTEECFRYFTGIRLQFKP